MYSKFKTISVLTHIQKVLIFMTHWNIRTGDDANLSFGVFLSNYKKWLLLLIYCTVGTCTYIIILWVAKGRLCLCLFIHVPYHTKMNKSLVPECPTIIDVRSFTVPYNILIIHPRKFSIEIDNLILRGGFCFFKNNGIVCPFTYFFSYF